MHGKIYENEQENVGIEGAHRSELVGESGLRHGKRFVQKKIRQHPAKTVQRAESKYVKATLICYKLLKFCQKAIIKSGLIFILQMANCILVK